MRKCRAVAGVYLCTGSGRPALSNATDSFRWAASALLVEKIVDLFRGFGVHAWHLREVRDRGALDRFQRSKVVKQRTLSRRADTGDFLQTRFADSL